MKLWWAVFIVIVLLSKCDFSRLSPPEFDSYYRQFREEAAKAQCDIPHKSVAILKAHPLYFPKDVIGMCFPYYGVIFINEAFWKIASDQERKELIFHELAHCAMGLNHDVAISSDGCPESLMFPSLPVCSDRWDHYMADLFLLKCPSNSFFREP